PRAQQLTDSGDDPVLTPSPGAPTTYVGGAPVLGLFTRPPVIDPSGNSVLHHNGDPMLHYRGDAVVHQQGEIQTYLGGEPALDEQGNPVYNPSSTFTFGLGATTLTLPVDVLTGDRITVRILDSAGSPFDLTSGQFAVD